MLKKTIENGKTALYALLQRCRATVGDGCRGTFRKLMELLVHSALLYGAEAWDCIGRMDALDQLQMRAHRIFFVLANTIPRFH